MIKMGPMIRDIDGFVPIEDILKTNFFTVPSSNAASPVKVTRFTVNAMAPESNPAPPANCPWEGLGMVDLGLVRPGNPAKQGSGRVIQIHRPNTEVINQGVRNNNAVNTARPNMYSRDNPYINIDGITRHQSPANFKEIPVIDLRPRQVSSDIQLANYGTLPNYKAPVHLGTIRLGTQSLPRPIKVKVQQPIVNNNQYSVTLARHPETNVAKEAPCSDYTDVIDSYQVYQKPIPSKHTMTLDRPKKGFSTPKVDMETIKSENHPSNVLIKHHKIKVMDARSTPDKPEPLMKFPLDLGDSIDERVFDKLTINSEKNQESSGSTRRGVTFKPSILVRHLGDEGLLGTESLPLEEAEKNTAGRVKRVKNRPQELMV